MAQFDALMVCQAMNCILDLFINFNSYLCMQYGWLTMDYLMISACFHQPNWVVKGKSERS